MSIGIDPENEHYPCCITWTTIPVVSWWFPFVGHPAICDIEGIHHDYSFPRIVHAGKKLILGRTFKYVPLEYGDGITDKDLTEAIDKANKKWKRKMHKYVFDNCHDYVVDILNDIKHKNKSDWNNLSLTWELLMNSTFVNGNRRILSYIFSACLYFCIFLMIIGLIITILYQLHYF